MFVTLEMIPVFLPLALECVQWNGRNTSVPGLNHTVGEVRDLWLSANHVWKLQGDDAPMSIKDLVQNLFYASCYSSMRSMELVY